MPDAPPATPVSEGSEPAAEAAPAPVRWPPPGLDRVQGDLWLIVRNCAAGSIVLVLPLLLAVAIEQPFWSLGVLGATWYVVPLAAIAGLVVLIAGLENLRRLLGRAAHATREGYGWRTVLHVAADVSRDTGFLLQGARIYSALEPNQRKRLLAARLSAPLLYLAAVLWMPVGFVVAVLMASRGAMGAIAVWVFTLGPTWVFLALGLLMRSREASLVRRAKMAWFAQPWHRQMEGVEAGRWNLGFVERLAIPGVGVGSSDVSRALGGWASAVLVLAVFIGVPVLTLTAVTGVTPVLATVSMPALAEPDPRIAEAEAYRPYRLETDPSVTPLQAGEALHALSFVGGDRVQSELERPPVRRYPQRWGAGAPRGGDDGDWTRWVVERLEGLGGGRGLDPDDRRALGRIAAHPARSELSTLARAGTLDAAGGRWPVPLPASATFFDLPLPNATLLREAAWAHLAAAAWHASEGRTEEAERAAREVISAGLLLLDDGPTVTDALAGSALARVGGDALVALYRAQGRGAEADAIVTARNAVERATRRMGGGSGGEPSTEAVLQRTRGVVLDPESPRGRRFEAFALISAVAPCINPNRIVFGRGEDWEAWTSDARAALVRTPADAEVFEVARGGLLGRPEGSSWVDRLLTLTLGDHGPGSCARQLGVTTSR